MALLDWGASAHRLEDRDKWAGWTAQQRAERQGLVVMNRRFLVLGKERMPNLASKALALACRHLPAHWEELHGYSPVLAETFSDIEQFHGTCYKAAGWEPCGTSKGFSKHRTDYYREHAKWVRDRLLGVGLSEHKSGTPVADGYAAVDVHEDTGQDARSASIGSTTARCSKIPRASATTTSMPISPHSNVVCSPSKPPD